MNWPVLLGFAILVILLLVFVIRRNSKDKKDLEKIVNSDYHKSKDEEGDADTEEMMK